MSENLPLRGAGLSKAFGDKQLWRGLDLEVPAGTSLALVGPSGSGKTTLLNCLAGLDTPDAGEVHVAGVELTQASGRVRRGLRRRHLGVLFQDHGLVPTQTIAQNVDYGFTGRRCRGAARAVLRNEALERVGIRQARKTKVLTLSGGEQQRVALARLIVQQPTVIFADEPTASLDGANVEVVQSVFQDFLDAGRTVVMSTHDDRMVEWAGSLLDLAGARQA